jgi:hypothetical protein
MVRSLLTLLAVCAIVALAAYVLAGEPARDQNDAGRSAIRLGAPQ